MLLTTVFLWALNLSITKYILEEGVAPLSYAVVRYALAGAIFVALTLFVERTLRIERRHLPVLAFAAVVLCVNQLCFVFALDMTNASTIGLILGAIPIFAALFGLALGRERLSGRFWLGAAVSFVGVGLVAVGSGSRGRGRIRGDPPRPRDLRDVGGVLGRGRAAHDGLLAVARERGRHPGDVGAACVDGDPADRRAGLARRVGDLGAARLRDGRAARPHEHPLVPLDLEDRARARDARGEPAAVRRGGARRRSALRAARPAAGARRPAHRRRESSSPAAERLRRRPT